MTAVTLTDRDENFRPQDDLYRHVNGAWLENYEIPADRARDGVFRALFDQAEEDVKAIITSAADTDPASPDAAEAAKIGAVYTSFMDTAAINAAGSAALAPDLDLLRGATNRAELAAAIGTLQRYGVASALGAYVNNDAGSPDRYCVYLTQSGLGLPDEAYYREDTHAEVREAYRGHLARMLTLAGVVSADDAASAADRVLAFETTLAAGHWDNVTSRDPQKAYNPTTRAELEAAAPGFDFGAWASALYGAGTGANPASAAEAFLDQIIVRQPSFIEAFGALWADADLADIALWQSWLVVASHAPYLNEEIVEENFDFSGRTLTGAQELRERWKRGVSVTEGLLSEAIGKIYVAEHFPPTHKDGMDALVADLLTAYGESINTLEWMSEETRARALDKLSKFTPKIGYPSKWRDYSALEVGENLLENIRAASAFETDIELAKLGGPIDRDEWHMPPQMVNAYYNPVMNEVVFPAAILQAPFFDPAAPAAVNYGGIGAVIGHEIGHGFDDSGSQFDGDGLLTDWWTEADRTEFTARTSALIAQFDALSPAQLNGSHHVNGAFTIGENIGDLGGLGIAIKAYRIARSRGVDADILEDVALQQLFVAFGHIWRQKGHDEETIRLLAIDPHSPNEFRCNQIVKNIDEFHEVYGTAPGDGLWLDPAERVQIW